MHTFDVTAIDLPRYRSLDPVPCDLDAAAVLGRLGPVGGRPVGWSVDAAAREIGEVVKRLEQWADPEPPRSSVLFWAGHGFSNGRDTHLFVPGAEEDVALKPEQFAEYLRPARPEPYWRIVVVQACGAGLFARRVWEHLERHDATAGLVLVAAGPDQGDGYTGGFRAVLDRVLSRPTSNDAAFGLHDLVDSLTREVEDQGWRLHRGSLRGREGSFLPVRSIGPLTTPVDVYYELRAALADLPAESDVGFARPGLGVAVGEFGWYFCGRHADRAAILAWFTDAAHGVYALTGASGCGKSAILGNVWLHAHPEVRAALGRLGRAGADWPEAAGLPPVDGSLPLTGATLPEVLRALAAAAGIAAPPAAATTDRLVDALVDGLRARSAGAVLTVFADGLDEAAEPGPIAEALRRVGEVPGVRIVVAARAWPIDRTPHVTVAEVARDGDAAAIKEYVVRRLTAADGPRDDPADDEVTAAARRIARRHRVGRTPQPFLHARLVVREILADPGLLSGAGRTRLRDLIRLDPGELFQAALRRMSATVRVEPFLRALAYSRGLGLPRDEPLWIAVAEALAGGGDGLLSEQDLDEVLAVAGPYVLLDGADGRSVYRLAHQSFRAPLLSGPAEPAITRALLRVARTPLHPYLRRHLAEHAAAAGAEGWAALAARTEVLDQVEVGTVVAGVMTDPGRFGALPAAVLGTVVTSHLALAATPADRTGLRRLGTARITGAWTSAQSAAERPGPGVAWWPVSARIHLDPPDLTLAAGGRGIAALAALPGVDDSPVLAAGTDDGSVRVWDPATGEETTGLDPTGGRVFDLAALERPGGVTLLLARDGDPVLVRDLAGHAPDVRLAGSARVRTLIGLDVSASTPVVVAGDIDGAVRLWDPVTGRTDGAALTGHTGAVHAVVAVPAPEGPLVATAGHDRIVRLWNPRSRRLVRRFADGHTRPVRAMAVVALPGAPVLLVTADDAGAVRRWDVASGQTLGGALELGCRVTTLVTCAVPGGAVFVVAGDENGRLLLVEPHTGGVWGEPVAVHDGPVRRMVMFEASAGAARDRLATAGDDGSVRIWDPARLLAAARKTERRGDAGASPPAAAPHQPEGAPWMTTVPGRTFLGRPPKPVALPGRARAAVTLPRNGDDGPALAAVAAPDGTVAIVEESADEWTVRRRLTGHTRPASALVVLGPLLISGGLDGTVRIWDADGLAHTLPLGTPVRALAAGPEEITVTADDGTLVIRLDPLWFTAGRKGDDDDA
ncbi:hypothetical protein [Actinoplanes sp. CA-252034]|uniref:hypothetical protein n=1 Tax=Actinoplanes sp. CA-252034 TaxID=3239906 RepID=UPI003D95CF95